MNLYKLDLHGIKHVDAKEKIIKFVTSHIANDTMPIKIVTGKSQFFIDVVREVAREYELDCYMDQWTNAGCWVLRERSKITMVFE